MKVELLDSRVNKKKRDQTGLNDEERNANDSIESFVIIKKFQELLNKKIINFVAKQDGS